MQKNLSLKFALLFAVASLLEIEGAQAVYTHCPQDFKITGSPGKWMIDASTDVVGRKSEAPEQKSTSQVKPLLYFLYAGRPTTSELPCVYRSNINKQFTFNFPTGGHRCTLVDMSNNALPLGRAQGHHFQCQ